MKMTNHSDDGEHVNPGPDNERPLNGEGLSKRARRPPKLKAAPEGFDLGKYEPCATFSTADWSQQIAKRIFLGQAVKSGHTADVATKVRALITRPLEPFAYEYQPQATSKGVARPAYVRPGIRPLRLHDLRLLTTQLAENGVVDGNELIDECATKYPPLADLAAYGRIQVDLLASDKDLIAAFRIWLKGYRREAERPGIKRHKSSDLQLELGDWHRNKILPYTDLTLWCEWKGLWMTESCLVDVLFPEGSTNGSRLRSTKRDIKAAMTLQNVHALLLAD